MVTPGRFLSLTFFWRTLLAPARIVLSYGLESATIWSHGVHSLFPDSSMAIEVSFAISGPIVFLQDWRIWASLDVLFFAERRLHLVDTTIESDSN